MTRITMRCDGYHSRSASKPAALREARHRAARNHTDRKPQAGAARDIGASTSVPARPGIMISKLRKLLV